ncbi:MAG: hypothetical protein HC923_02205 [Myxococcales bacterium]|nr:hypothetical protein [Myxococcales bacterium]
MNRVGIRREDKSRWEARTPLIPEDLGRLRAERGLDVVVQSSGQRAFADAEFTQVGIPVLSDLRDCPVILGVKEIPVDRIAPARTYLFFSHVIKGQPYNMPMLRRLLEYGCTLIDYERIVDELGRRVVAFGVHAGLAGAIDTLWSLGKRWEAKGHRTPLSDLQPAHAYSSLREAKAAIARAARGCREDRTFRSKAPVTLGVTGYGRVAKGVHEILDVLEPVEVAAEELGSISSMTGRFVRVRFEECHFAEPLDGTSFSKARYYADPESMRGIFGSRYLPTSDRLAERDLLGVPVSAARDPSRRSGPLRHRVRPAPRSHRRHQL